MYAYTCRGTPTPQNQTYSNTGLILTGKDRHNIHTAYVYQHHSIHYTYLLLTHTYTPPFLHKLIHTAQCPGE